MDLPVTAYSHGKPIRPKKGKQAAYLKKLFKDFAAEIDTCFLLVTVQK